MHDYYIDVNGQREGPFDLLTIMQRVRSGKLTLDSLIYMGDSQEPVSASTIPEIAAFFEHRRPVIPQSYPTLPSFRELLRTGWRFMLQHDVITVYSGGIMLLGLAMMYLPKKIIGPMPGWVLGWCVVTVISHLYMVFLLRLYRGQRIGWDFITQSIDPVLGPLLLNAILLALAITGVALISPGLIWVAFSFLLSVSSIFAPLLIFDRRAGGLNALAKSPRLLARGGREAIVLAVCLLLMHCLCLQAIILLPLSMPIFAVAVCELYERLSAG